MNHFRAREKKQPEPETPEVQTPDVVEALRKIDIDAVYVGGGSYKVHGLTDAGREFVKQNQCWGPEAVWGPRPAKLDLGCTGIGPFLKAAKQAGLVVRESR